MAPILMPILIVDDDEAIRETLRFLFEDAGYDVEEAEDGVAALARLRASARPMVVLLDLMMPRMNGDQMLATVADDPILRTFHVYIMVTASSRARLVTVADWAPAWLCPVSRSHSISTTCSAPLLARSSGFPPRT